MTSLSSLCNLSSSVSNRSTKLHSSHVRGLRTGVSHLRTTEWTPAKMDSPTKMQLMHTH